MIKSQNNKKQWFKLQERMTEIVKESLPKRKKKKLNKLTKQHHSIIYVYRPCSYSCSTFSM